MVVFKPVYNCHRQFVVFPGLPAINKNEVCIKFETGFVTKNNRKDTGCGKNIINN